MRCNMTFSVIHTVSTCISIMWCQWHCWKHQGQNNWNKVQHNFLVMWCHCCWHQCHMTPAFSSMPPFCLLGQGDKRRCDIPFLVMWCHWHKHQHHMMPLAPEVTSHDAYGNVNATISFIGSRQLEWGVISLFWSCDVKGTILGSHGQDNWNEMQQNSLVMWHHWY